MRAWPFVLLLLTLPVMGRAAPRSSAAKALHDLFTAAWDQEMQERPEDASELGDRRWNDRWMDRSPEAYARRDQNSHAILAKLAKIDRTQLNKTDANAANKDMRTFGTLGVLRHELRDRGTRQHAAVRRGGDRPAGLADGDQLLRPSGGEGGPGKSCNLFEACRNRRWPARVPRANR